MFSHIKSAIICEDGMTTAEYAVGTVAAAGLGGILIKILTSSEVEHMLLSLFERALHTLFSA
jgi:hypothetical protein